GIRKKISFSVNHHQKLLIRYRILNVSRRYHKTRNSEASVFWLFALKTYGFTPIEYSYFDSIRSSLMVIGSLVFLPLFTKVFKLHDAVIIIITFFDKIASNVLLLLFVNTYGLYAGWICR
ncbi:hypothetical protein AMK59_4820, partial [Oryctes borbonicus]